MPLDEVTLSLGSGARTALSGILALIMFGVALRLRTQDFRRVAGRPGVVLFGVGLQLVALPALTWAVAGAVAPTGSVALGMMVVAACPGGSVSNFLTQVARGDAALSVSLTAVTSTLAVLTTPLNIVLWSSLSPETSVLLRDVALDRTAFVAQVFLTLGLPLALGMVVAARAPLLAARLSGPWRSLSLLALALFVVAALVSHRSALVAHGASVMPAVIAHNALALGLGYLGAALIGQRAAARRAFAFEIGIQNSGLGLVILLAHFDGLGGAALVTAGWGFWHLISGGVLAMLWSRRAPAAVVAGEPLRALSLGE